MKKYCLFFFLLSCGSSDLSESDSKTVLNVSETATTVFTNCQSKGTVTLVFSWASPAGTTGQALATYSAVCTEIRSANISSSSTMEASTGGSQTSFGVGPVCSDSNGKITVTVNFLNNSTQAMSNYSVQINCQN